MKRCKTCKHWDTKNHIKGWGGCALAGSTEGQPDHEATLAMASDFEGYMASLSTAENFGCVQWEKKE